jgi:hypothetical protein
MHKSPKGYAEKLPLHYAAIQKAALEHPELLPPTTVTHEEHISVLAGLLTEGDCGAVVLVGGRHMAAAILDNITHIEDFDTCIALREAIARGFTYHDGKGGAELEFSTPTRTAWLAGEASAGENCSNVELLISEERLRELMLKTHAQYSNALPAALFEPQFVALGLGKKEAPNFDENASLLHIGMAGSVLFQLGREYCRYLLANLESIGAPGLCRVLARAVEAGVSAWDGLGYLPTNSSETNMPDVYGAHTYLEEL